MTPETISREMISAAQEAYDAFQTIKPRDEEIDALKDERPEWVYDAVHAAHGDFFPDDWRYKFIRDAFGAISDAGEDADAQEVCDDYSDPDIYTSDRLQWLASNLNRPAYCDEAQAEFGFEDDMDIIERIGWGQSFEKKEVFYSVLESLAAHIDEMSAA